jgi:hypothetical protein
VDLRVLVTAIVLATAGAVTLLGLGGEAGNAAGILFWTVLVVLGASGALTLWRGHEKQIATRRTDRESR